LSLVRRDFLLGFGRRSGRLYDRSLSEPRKPERFVRRGWQSDGRIVQHHGLEHDIVELRRFDHER
jgi:hypothetical protein